MSTQITSVVSTTKSDIVQRSSIKYAPSAWGHFFISNYTLDTELMDAWKEEAKILKEKVKKMLTIDFMSMSIQEKLMLIDTIQGLGISYHFNKEIQNALKQLQHVSHDNLYTTSLLFRLLREHGYNISCDVFNKYKDEKGNFKESLSKDVEGLLSLYEATHLRVHGETILDEALIFASTNLQQIIILMGSNLFEYASMAVRVSDALNRPLRRWIPRVQACKYITLYQEDETHNTLLLRLAKLDYNILQKQHQEEIALLSEWWRKMEVEKKLPFARDRIVECYFWAVGAHHEPQYETSRKFFTKVISLTSIIDDIFDNYGTEFELKIFTEAVEKWEIGYINKLPEYMRTCYQTLLDTYDEMEEEMTKEGNPYAAYIAKEAMKNQVRAYYEESKWLKSESMPSFDEYLEVALVTCAYELLATTSLVGMGEIASKQVFDWLTNKPQILNASKFICRIMDDMVSHEFESKRNHIPSAIQCYMKQYNVSKEQVYATLNKEIEDAWKDIIKSFLESQGIPISICTMILNLARVIDFLYKGEDSYTKSNDTLNQYISSMLVTPMEV